MKPPTLAIVVKGYPRLSETFIAQEIAAIQDEGFGILIVSLRHPTDTKLHDIHKRIRAEVLYLPEYLHHEPGRVLRAFWSWLGTPELRTQLKLWWHDLRRDPSRNRLRRLGQALVLARELPPSIRHLYVHYLHTPASVGRYCARLRGLSYSLSAHAKDIWTTPKWEIREKLNEAVWTTTCSKTNQIYLQSISPNRPTELIYHGLSTMLFPPFEPASKGSSGQPVRIITVARAVPKKGLDILLQALASLRSDLEFEWLHLGSGPELLNLKQLARRLEIENRVTWVGTATHAEVHNHLRQADIFCLPARVAMDGDRDGLPNVLLEALSQKVAVVATDVSAIPELIDNDRTGLLVKPEDYRALSAALERLILQPKLRLALAARGQERVLSDFQFECGFKRLASLLSRSCSTADTRL